MARRGRAWCGSGCAGRVRVRRREGSQGKIKGEAVILGVGARKGIPAISARFGRGRCAGGEIADRSNRWA